MILSTSDDTPEEKIEKECKRQQIIDYIYSFQLTPFNNNGHHSVIGRAGWWLPSNCCDYIFENI